MEVAFRIQIDHAGIVCTKSFVRIVEAHSSTLAVRTRLGDVVQAEHDILARNSNRLTGSRVKNVVGRQHENAAFELRFER